MLNKELKLSLCERIDFGRRQLIQKEFILLCTMILDHFSDLTQVQKLSCNDF